MEWTSPDSVLDLQRPDYNTGSLAVVVATPNQCQTPEFFQFAVSEEPFGNL
jgi:hypothetical protein